MAQSQAGSSKENDRSKVNKGQDDQAAFLARLSAH